MSWYGAGSFLRRILGASMGQVHLLRGILDPVWDRSIWYWNVSSR